MKNDKKKMETEPEEDESIVEGVVDSVLPGMGGLVRNLRRKNPELDSRIKEREAEINKRIEAGESPEPKISYGIRVRTLAQDTPGKRQTGAWGERRQKPEKKVIEPEIDLFDEGDYIEVIAEMPGVSEDRIEVTLGKKTLIISASDKGREYRKEIPVPCPVRIGKKRYQNGVLEIMLEKENA